MILSLTDAEFRYGDNVIFRNVNLDLYEGDRVGIVGANGAGKSTLLSAIVGEHDLFSGNLTKKRGLTIGYLRQNGNLSSELTLYEELKTVFAEQIELIGKISKAAEELASQTEGTQGYVKAADKYHRLCLEADAADAYNVDVKIKTVLGGMGMSCFADQCVNTLSGGEKTKAALCKLLLSSPELMILDEPTNHLDYKTLDWLETFLSASKSSLIIVSHDRYFLDKLVGKIWDVERGKITAYKGNYTKYKHLKAEAVARQAKEYQLQQREIAKLTDYVERNKARASTADMAKSRQKALDRMEVVDAPVSEESPPRFKFTYTSEPSEFPLKLCSLNLTVGEKQLISGANLTVKRGHKVALLGLNGTGKSTLIKRIMEGNPYDLGKIVFGKNVRVGYYDQENLNLDGNLRVLDQLWFDNTRMSQTEVRGLLAAVTLGADDVYKTVSSLSGGERAKLGLAMIMAKDNNLLLLDEPTNHLDLPSREALEQALMNYTGTVLFVSHDRYFVQAVASEIAEIEDKKLTEYECDYNEFMRRKKEVAAQATVDKSILQQQKSPQSTYRNAKQRAEQTNFAKKIKELENQITQAEKRTDELNALLANPTIAADYTKTSQIVAELNQVEQTLAELTEQWAILSEQLQ